MQNHSLMHFLSIQPDFLTELHILKGYPLGSHTPFPGETYSPITLIAFLLLTISAICPFYPKETVSAICHETYQIYTIIKVPRL